MDILSDPSESQFHKLYLEVLVNYSDTLIEKDDFKQAQIVLEMIMEFLERKLDRTEEQEVIFLESKEKLELAIEVNTSED